MTGKKSSIFLCGVCACLLQSPEAYVIWSHPASLRRSSCLRATKLPEDPALSRRSLLDNAARLLSVGASAALIYPSRGEALVRGNAPPSDYRKKNDKSQTGEAPGPRSMSEAKEMGEKKELAMRSQMESDEMSSGQDTAFSTTKGGVRYRDMVIGSGKEISKGSTVDLRYRVLKLGKRSYDGLSGEATLVFSLGYGEDDDKEGSFVTVPVGQGRLIVAVDEAIVSMREGGRRRVLVRPDRGQGWRKAETKCASTFDMGMAAGIPGAVVEKIEDCIDQTLEPRPLSYGAKRRMARRFDEALIVEIEPVAVR